MNGQVKGVFFLEELVGPPSFPGLHGLGQGFQITAGAKTSLAFAPKQDKVNLGFFFGYFQGCLEQSDHFQIEAVDGLGPV